MKKYLLVMYLELVQIFNYRLSFILWRFRNIFNLIFIYFLWTSVFTGRHSLFSYSKEQLVSYIIVINVISSLVMSTRTTDIANDIQTGDIANYLLKPFSLFPFFISKEIVDKLVNFFFSICEILVLVLIFQPHLYIPNNVSTYIAFVFALICSLTISFFISLSISLIAFWFNDIWAPRFMFITVSSFLAGTFFPLDILPRLIFNIILLTPFPYLIFLPSNILIKGFSPIIITQMIIAFCWCIGLFVLSRIIWINGIKNYNAYGR